MTSGQMRPSLMSTKIAVVTGRIGVSQFGTHGDEMRRHRCKNGRICLDRDMMTALIKLSAELGQLLGLDERFAPCDDDMLAIVFRDRLDRFREGDVLVLRIPRGVSRIAPHAPQIAVAGPKENGGYANQFAFALNCMEKFAVFHD